MAEKLNINEKYMLRILEASEYYGIGIKKMRRIAEDGENIFAVGNRIRAELIGAHTVFEEYYNPNCAAEAPFVRCLKKIDKIHHSVEGKAAYLIWLKKEINKARNLSVIISEKRLKFWMSGAMIKKKLPFW